MPSLVFPAPGSPYATRLPTTFSGFDIAPITKTTIRNLLLDSQTFIGTNWGVGPYTIPFNAINDYIDDGLLQSNVTVQLSGDAWLVTARSNTQRVGQQIAVLPNTTYTFSFFARRGTATDNRYKILDFSRNTDLVGPTSYYSQINNSTLTRITVTCTTSLNTRILVVYPVWDIVSGYGNSYIVNAQFELGPTASTYQATFGTENSAAGITVNRVVQLINKLPTFTSPTSRHAVAKLSSAAQLKSTARLPDAAKLSSAAQLKSTAGLPGAAKLYPDIQLKSATRLQVPAKLYPDIQLKSIVGLTISQLDKAKFSAAFSEVRAKNGIAEKLSSAAKLKSTARLPDAAKLSSATQLKSTTGLQVAAKLSTASQLRDITARLNTDQINREKYSAALQEVLQIASNLNTFDNVGLVEGTVYSVTGVASGVSTNAVLDYIYDLDKITVTSSPVSQLIVYFDNPNMRYVFGIGSYVTLSDNASVKYTTQVLDRSPATVTVAKPTNWNNTELFSTIASASISVYPQIYVVPTLTPTNSRERLAQSQLVPIRGSSSLNSTYSIPLQDAHFFDYTGLEQSLNLGNISSPTFRLTSTALLKFGTTVSNAKLKGLSYRIRTDKLMSNAKLKDTNSILTQSNIKLDIFKLTGGVNLRTDFTDRLKVRNTQVFSAPVSDNLNLQLYKLTSTATPLSADKLMSNAKLKDTNSILTQSNIKLDIFKLKDIVSNKFNINFIDLAKFKNNVIFTAPTVDKLTSAAVLRESLFNTDINNLRATSVLRPITTDIENNYIEKLKLPANRTSVFDTPVSDNLNLQLYKLISTATPLTADNLNLQLYKLISTATPLTADKLMSNAKLKDTNSILTQSNIKLDIFKLTGGVNLRTDFTDRLKVRNTQVFSAPINDKLTSAAVLREPLFDADINNLRATSVLRPITTDIENNYIEKLKLPANRTSVFDTPVSNKLTANAVLKAAMPTIRLASFKISSIPVRSVVYNLNTNSLTKPVTSIKEAVSVFNYYNVNDTFYQSDVRTNQKPTNAREILFYAEMAPGSRTNNSIQQGYVFSPDGSKLSTDQLEVFDNVKFASEPFYNVTSQANGTRANSILEYIYDLDIITVSTSPINTLQLSFDNAERVFNIPYPVGSYVALTRLNYPMYFAQVIDSSFNTVTISLPDDWSKVHWVATQIGSASPTVFPKVNVRPAGYPTNSRELLFYAEMSPGYLVNRSIQYGNVFDQLTAAEIKKPTFLERDAWRVREIYRSKLFNTSVLDASIVVKGLKIEVNLSELFNTSVLDASIVVKGLKIEANLSKQSKILPRTNISEIVQGLLIGQLNPIKWGVNPNLGTRFAEAVILASPGGIIRLKVGKFNKMHDVAVKKKDPIQFWN